MFKLKKASIKRIVKDVCKSKPLDLIRFCSSLAEKGIRAEISTIVEKAIDSKHGMISIKKMQAEIHL